MRAGEGGNDLAPVRKLPCFFPSEVDRGKEGGRGGREAAAGPRATEWAEREREGETLQLLLCRGRYERFCLPACLPAGKAGLELLLQRASVVWEGTVII